MTDDGLRKDSVGDEGAVLVVDARGLRCPLPVVRLAAAARDAAPGSQVVVLWTDPAARHDIPAWARMRGHEVVRTEPRGDGTSQDAFATTVRLAG